MANIRVELQLEDGSFTTGVLRAGQSLKSFKDELARTDPQFRKLAKAGQDNFLMFKRHEEGAQSLTKRFRDLSIGIGGVSLAFHALSGASSGTIGNIIRVNAEMEKLRYQMAGMSDAADPMAEATEQVAELQRMAASTPFSLGQLSNSFVKMKAAGLDPLNGSLRALTDGLAAFGASDEQLNRVTIAITQMQGKGVLSMEELRQQLGESMPSAMKLMARSMGVTVGELSKQIATGTVDSKKALDKWFQEVELSYGGMGELMMKTFSGQMAKIKTSLQVLVDGGEIGGAFDMLKEKMEEFSTFLGSQQAKELFDALGVGMQGVITVGASLLEYLNDIKNVIMALGPVVPLAFGGAVALAAGVRMIKTISAMKLGYSELVLNAQILKKNLFEVNAAAASSAAAAAAAIAGSARAAGAATAAGAAGAAGAAAGTAAAAAGASRFLVPLATAGSRLLGLLGPIALGIGVLGPIAWDIGKGIYSWVTGAEEAKEKIESVTDAAVRLKKEERDDALAEIDARIEALKQDILDREAKGFSNKSQSRELDGLMRQRNDIVEKYEVELTEKIEDQDRERFQSAKKRIADEGRLSSRAYDKAMNENSKRYEEELANANKTGASVRQIQEAFKSRTMDLRASRMKEIIGLYDKEIGKMRQQADQGKESYGTIAMMLEERMRLEEQLASMTPEKLTIETLVAPEDDTKKGEKLKRTFDDAREKVESLNAELNGASGAVAKLAYQIKRGDFGNLDHATEETEKMLGLLMDATVQAEALGEAFDALNKVENTIDGIVSKMQEEIVKNKAIAAGIDPEDDPLAYYEFQKQNAIGIFEDIGKTGEETLSNFTKKVTGSIDLNITAAQSLATEIRANTFGDASVVRIDAVDSALKRVLGTTGLISQSMSGINFGNMGMPGAFGGGSPLIRPNVDGGILDLIASVESRGDYNATLDNGRWTNGPQNLVAMTLNEVRALQAQMRTPENRALYGDGAGSSALGRYQIVGNTLDSLIKSMGLTGNELFSPEMQDRMAMQLFAGRGANPAGLRQEWAGLANVSDAEIMAAIARSTSGPTKFNAANLPAAPTGNAASVAAAQGRIEAKEGTAAALQPELESSRIAAATRKFFDDLDAAGAALRDPNGDLEQFGAMGKKAREMGQKGDFGTDSEALAEIYKRADAYDKEAQTIRDRAKATKEVAANEEKLKEQLAEIEDRREEALKKVKDPNYKGRSDELRKLISLEAEQLALVEKINGGKDNDAYRNAKDSFAKQRAALTGAESAEALQELARATEASEKSAMSAVANNERNLRKIEFDQRMQELAALRDQAIADGQTVAEAEKLYNRAVAAEKARYREENKTALMQQLDQMRNLEENLNAEASSWATSLADNLFQNASTDSAGLAAFANSIRTSIAKSLTTAAAGIILKPFETLLAGNGEPGSGLGGMIQKALASAFNFDFATGTSAGAGASGGGLFSGLADMLKSAMSGIGGMFSSMFNKSGMVPVKHTGGIIGSSGGWGRSTPLSNFIGAPKFHTGGIVGGPKFRTGLNPSEVPIIAQKGEGIFTREQMSNLGGSVNSQSVQINAPITVNANGGTAEQNADLAKQMARESEGMFRGIVRDEMVRQMRPGGMIR